MRLDANSMLVVATYSHLFQIDRFKVISMVVLSPWIAIDFTHGEVLSLDIVLTWIAPELPVAVTGY